MNIQSLTKVYEDQLNNLQDLLMAAQLKQKAVIQNNRKTLEIYTLQEESVLTRINRKEQERENFIEKIFNEHNRFNLKEEDVNFENVIAGLLKLFNPEELTKFNSLREEIKFTTQKIKDINFQNKRLIEQANGVIKQTLGILLKSQKKPLLDRKI
ncbi:MAG: hypothetical protein CVV23_05960 [Ignavibacteriae bacterium HGW-Ignavibacteriae-2]|jgi:flagellar biosynthesis/type III secretory pathway chaperone|nr:MAG: hypothetical protein CVV23_05960 [Ignavibacteriae bacterium HGW-Ignavibacteriae-2]